MGYHIFLRTVSTIVIAHSFCAYRDTRVSNEWCLLNLVPRSHSVTGNVRSGKVRRYTIFHWLLKQGWGNAIYAPIGLFRGALSEVWFSQAHVLF